MNHPVVYIGIGNSDDKLSQVQWARFVQATRDAIRRFCAAGLADDDGEPPESGGPQMVGDWLSHADSPWQNACIAFTVPNDTDPDLVRELKETLGRLAYRFQQDGIAWAHAAQTGYLSTARPE